MARRVLLTADAAGDLERLYEYILDQDGPDRAEHVLGSIESAFESLNANPHRGVWPAELLDLGIREYREILFKPYRIIYRVRGEYVYIVLITDGRRDMQTLLQHRLLHG